MTFSSPSARSPRAMIRSYWQHAPGTATIVAFTLAVWLITAVQSGSVNSTSQGSVANAFVLWGPYVHEGGAQLARMVTYLLLHAGIGHLAANMILLLLVGYEVEQWAGTAALVGIYLFSGVTAAAAVVLLDPLSPTVGASGAIYGLMPALVLIAWELRQSLTGPLVLVAVNLGYTLMVPQVSLWGHLGGLAGGELVAIVMWAVRRRKRTAR